MDGACQARERAPGRYQPRRPSESVLYRCIQQHLETWLAQCRDGTMTRGRCRRMWSGSSAVTWNAASSPAVLPAPTATGAATLASVPAQKYDDKRAEQPIAAENPRRKSTLDPPHPPDQNQARVIELPIRN